MESIVALTLLSHLISPLSAWSSYPLFLQAFNCYNIFVSSESTLWIFHSRTGTRKFYFLFVRLLFDQLTNGWHVCISFRIRILHHVDQCTSYPPYCFRLAAHFSLEKVSNYGIFRFSQPNWSLINLHYSLYILSFISRRFDHCLASLLLVSHLHSTTSVLHHFHALSLSLYHTAVYQISHISRHVCPLTTNNMTRLLPIIPSTFSFY